MRQGIILLLFIFIWVFPLSGQESALEDRLYELPDVIFEKIEAPEGYSAAYELKIKQPMDHKDPDKGYFYQRVYLSHKCFHQPMVINTSGYSARRNFVQELTEFLGANQLIVEHRFFGESVPDTMDWDYLNLEQATADLHKINQLFKRIYDGKWLSTGVSKGGVTTIFYRYFYPRDVDVSVPYVAPVNKERDDQRIYAFLDTVGTDACREKIRAFQIRLLENRDEVMRLLKFYSLGARQEFTYFTFEEAFELAVMEYPFAFWQWGDSCKNIPSDEAPLDEAVEYFASTRPLGLFSDRDIKYFAPHYYQSAEEMGYYGYETHKFKELIKALPTDRNPMATFVPDKMAVEFNRDLLDDVHEWLEEKGNRFIYIYGGKDTWSACAVQPSDEVDSQWFFLKGQDHGGARIKNMTPEEKKRLVKTLEQWLEIKIDDQ